MSRDIFLPVNDPTTPTLITLPEGTAFVALCGELAPGTLAVLIPRDSAEDLHAITDAFGTIGMSSAVTPDRANIPIVAKGGVVLWPGESAELDPDRLYVACALSGWRAGSDLSSLFRGQAAVDAAQGWSLARVQPILRCSHIAPIGQQPFGKVSEIFVCKSFGTGPSIGDPTLFLPPGAGTVCLFFTDNADDTTIVGAETGDFNVRWGWETRSNGLLYTKHPNDNLDSGGRTSISASHSAELYEVPAGAVAIDVSQPSTAAAFWLWLAVGW